MFAQWLAEQADRPDHIGHLARRAISSQRFPPDRVWRLYAFLNWAGPDEKMRTSIKQAHREWRRAQ